ncbi:MAG TPA: FUN14 domain-containing protein [Trueperaceae bacterium]|nr:FUN14 domain-containing protein [Trueperaceae bacterium]
MEAPDLTSVLPWVQQLTFGAVAGFIAGYALKKVGKVVAIVLGLLFVALQLLAWSGFISVDWGVIQRQVDPLLEGESLQRSWRGLLAMLTYNIPFAAAFVPAFILGVRRG